MFIKDVDMAYKKKCNVSTLVLMISARNLFHLINNIKFKLNVKKIIISRFNFY